MRIDEAKILNRKSSIFQKDMVVYEEILKTKIRGKKFLVLGGAGTIGQAVCKEIISRFPAILHVVDLSENNLVELVRDIRSSFCLDGIELKTLALDVGSSEFKNFVNHGNGYDYLLNLSAMKHVRSERDPFTLMRMLKVNVINTIKTMELASSVGVEKYFAVSTDKASEPVNLMGASKRAMELFLESERVDLQTSTARFANVAFSDGSLLHGFVRRLQKCQPIVGPSDIKRYFMTKKESGFLCVFSCLLGENKDCFFPKITAELPLISFTELAERFLFSQGLVPIFFDSETEAIQYCQSGRIKNTKEWPCYFSFSDTTGEKYEESFYSDVDQLDLKLFHTVGVIKKNATIEPDNLNEFYHRLKFTAMQSNYSKEEIISLFKIIIPNFEHFELGKNLDEKL